MKLSQDWEIITPWEYDLDEIEAMESQEYKQESKQTD